MQVRQTGVVRVFLRDRHFGFIHRERQSDLFFRRCHLQCNGDLIFAGRKVEFEVARGAHGDQAIRVTLVEESEGSNG